MAIEWKQIAFVENSAAQSVLGNPTGSPAVATPITVAEQTLVGRITGGNVDDLSVTQVKTLIGSSTTSATGVIELATQAEVLAGTDTSRAVVPVDLAAKVAIDVNPKAPSQGVNMTYASGGSTGIQVADNDNIDFGTGNFTLVWKGSLPDYTPSASQFLLFTRSGASLYNGHALYFSTTGVIRVLLYRNDAGVAFSSTVAPTITDNTTHEIVAVITRETASIAGSVVFYVDGVQLGASVAIPAGVPESVSNTDPLYVMGSPTLRTEGSTHFAATFNRALSAADVLALYRNGINFADKWGSQTAVYTSDFSAGVDSFLATRVTAAGNIDYDTYTDVLRFYADNASNTHYIYHNSLLTAGKKYRISLDYNIPAAQTQVNNFRLRAANESSLETAVKAVGAWTNYIVEVTPSATGALMIGLMNGTTTSFVGANVDTDDRVYIKNLVVLEIGATIALEPEGIQPAPGQWLDSSTNKLHAMQPAAGSSLIRPKREFEIRWTNTWAGTHEAQYIGGLNQAILPVGCYIQSIIGVVSGTTIEDIIVGDGSDTDRWVTVTTGLAAGTVAFAIASPISDGTNYKMVVDPDANFTGSISWTIRGIIL